MPSIARWIVAVAVIGSLGCYAATIETGRPASDDVIHETFASSWIYGLVPPDVVDAAERCPNGVAKVETRLSFLNQVVRVITIGIYTPMEIRVTCAAPGSMGAAPDIVVPDASDDAAVREALTQAAKTSADDERPVFVALGG